MQIPGRIKEFFFRYRTFLVYLTSTSLLLGCGAIFFQSEKQAKPYIYKVQSGDTLGSIASLCELSPEQIASFNELQQSQLHFGDILLLPNVQKLSRGQALQQLSITGRQQWSADKAKAMRSSAPLSRITVHHTSDSTHISGLDDHAFLKSIQRYHQKTKNWADIAYHFLIGKNGTIYQGRELFSQGAHVKRHNSGNIGIALLGNYQKHRLNAKQKASLVNLLDALRERYEIPREQVYAHLHLGKTHCPGKYTLSLLENYKSIYRKTE